MRKGVALQWRLKQQNYRMQGNRCPVCQQVFFPPRPGHPNCSGTEAGFLPDRSDSDIPIELDAANPLPIG